METPVIGLKLGFDFASQHVLRSDANLLVYHLATLEHEQGRDVADAELHGEVALCINVYFTYYRTVCEIGREFVYDRAYHAAGSAPLGPEVNEHGLV
jgi:hypothetical protein